MMPANSSEYVFNLDAIIFSGLALFLMLLFHATYMFIVSRQYENSTDSLIAKKYFGLVPLAFYVAAFVLTISHLIEIFIWGYVLSWAGLISNTHQAMLFAGSTYTTVGFGANPLPLNWDLVMVVIALNGMVAFGWSISVLFGMAQVVTLARRTSRSHLGKVQ